MSGSTEGAGRIGRNPMWVAIGRCLARTYDGHLKDPPPERFLALLAELDAREQKGASGSLKNGGPSATRLSVARQLEAAYLTRPQFGSACAPFWWHFGQTDQHLPLGGADTFGRRASQFAPSQRMSLIVGEGPAGMRWFMGKPHRDRRREHLPQQPR